MSEWHPAIHKKRPHETRTSTPQLVRELIATTLWTIASHFDWVEWRVSGLADRIAGPGLPPRPPLTAEQIDELRDYYDNHDTVSGEPIHRAGPTININGAWSAASADMIAGAQRSASRYTAGG